MQVKLNIHLHADKVLVNSASKFTSSTYMKLAAIFNSSPYLFKMSNLYNLDTETNKDRSRNKYFSPEERTAICASVAAG